MVKSYTDLEQSRKLAEILPIESADMWWNYFYNIISDTSEYGEEPILHKPSCEPELAIPCWSLSSLLNYLREIDYFPEIDADEFSVTMNINYYDEEEARLLAPIHNIKVKAESFIDACYEMILKLNEQKLL